MTRQTFLRNCEKYLKNKMVENFCGDIRTKSPILSCPLTELCYVKTGERFGVGDWDKAAEKLGLSEKNGIEIAEPADTDDFNSPLRKALLRRLGLSV